MPKKIDLKATLAFTKQLAQKVGQYILKSRSKVEIKAYKDRQDIVTNIDLAAEKIIIEAIRNKYPDHAIYSEEAGESAKKSTYRWVIDPIDGTKMYLRKLPFYSVLIALEKDDDLVLSVMYQPVEDITYSAAINQTSRCDGKVNQPSPKDKLQDAIVFTYLPNQKVAATEAKDQWLKLHHLSRHSYRVRESSQESIAMAWVASGKIEASINLGIKNNWHDVASGFLVARQAGCSVTTLQGEQITKDNFEQGFIVSNGKIHQDLVEILS